MIKIWTPTILLPPVLLDDKRLAAAKAALEYQLRLVSEDAPACLILPRLDELPELMIDLLANQYHVDFYDQHLSIDQKRALVRDSLLWHKRKGTPAAVEEMTRRVFGTATVEEWFEYKGEPFHFRLTQDISDLNLDVGRDTVNRLRQAVAVSKNARSWLDCYRFLLNYDEGVSVKDESKVKVELKIFDEYRYNRPDLRFDGSLRYGSSNTAAEFGNAFYDGKICYGPGANVIWKVAGAEISNLQAYNFEEIVFESNQIHEQIADAEENYSMQATLAAFEDTVALAEEDLNARLTQKVSSDQTLSVDVELIDRDELERWQSLQAQLEQEFDERCECGASEYEWHRSCVRLGEEKYCITDPQLLTVEIKCRRCGNILAEYVVPDQQWEVLL